MKNLFKDFVNLLYPDICPGCGNVLAEGEISICLSCQIDLPLFKNEVIIDNILGGRVPIKFGAIYLKFYSNSLTQRLLHELKYNNNKDLGIYLGEQFALSHEFGKSEKIMDYVIPIPLHENKLKQRGYNQSTLIARGISRITGWPLDSNNVRRTMVSETQTNKSREERWANVAGVFECDKGVLEDKNVLLVDDVITTGATLEACAQEILDAGANSISFAVLATAM